MKHGRKALCLLLALALLLGCLPAAGAVSAREAEPWRTVCAATKALAADGQPVEPTAVCTVRFDLNGYGPDAPAAQTVTKGQPALDPGFTDYTDGMLFDGWYTEPACVNLYDFSAPVNNNLTLYASYVRGHVIRFDPNGAPEGGMEDVYVKHGEAFVLPECGFLYAGKALGYWTVSGRTEHLDPGSIMTVYQDYTVTAVWTGALVYFDANGGSGYMPPMMCRLGTSELTLPDCSFTPPEGKRFVKWSLGFSGESVTIYGVQTTFAIWEDSEYTVRFLAGGGTGNMSNSVAVNGVFVLPECGFTAPAGKVFRCWYIPDATGTIDVYYPGHPVKIDSDVEITAQWISKGTETFTVSFETSLGEGIMPSINAEAGSSIVVPSCSFTPPNHETLVGYFATCTNDPSFFDIVSPGDHLVVNGDMVLTALWGLDYFIVSFDTCGHGTAPSPQEVFAGERAVRPEDPSEPGWIFTGWFFGYAEYHFDEIVYGDMTLFAHWRQAVYSVFLSTDGGGTASVSASSAKMDDNISVAATPKDGYVVDRITYMPTGGEEVDITSTKTFTMPPANVAVAVRFKPVGPVSYPITLEVVGGGSAALSKTAAEPWERVTLIASPEEGGALLRAVLVSPDGTERDITERMGFNMPEGPAAVRVEFTSIPHHLTLEVGPGGTANLSAETAPEGEEIIVTTTPNSGFRLKSILVKPAAGSGATMNITETGRFQMPAYDVKVVVVFEELPPVPVYSLRLEVGPGGTASLSASEAEAGTEITVSTAPDRGRAVQAIRVKTESGSVTDVTAAGRFSMPAENVSVEVVFAWINPFVDVSEADWFYIPVLWAYYNEPQITAGTDPTHFSPGNTVTRAEAMVFFWAANGHPEPETTKSPFKDVKKSHWAFKAVMWAVENGITGGTDTEGKYFSPARTCTRSEILQFLYAAMGKPEYHIANPYSDVKNKHWYKDGAIWAYEYGLERGENGKFHATTPCTRAYVVTYLYRYFTGELLDE